MFQNQLYVIMKGFCFAVNTHSYLLLQYNCIPKDENFAKVVRGIEIKWSYPQTAGGIFGSREESDTLRNYLITSYC